MTEDRNQLLFYQAQRMIQLSLFTIFYTMALLFVITVSPTASEKSSIVGIVNGLNVNPIKCQMPHYEYNHKEIVENECFYRNTFVPNQGILYKFMYLPYILFLIAFLYLLLYRLSDTKRTIFIVLLTCITILSSMIFVSLVFTEQWVFKPRQKFTSCSFRMQRQTLGIAAVSYDDNNDYAGDADDNTANHMKSSASTSASASTSTSSNQYWPRRVSEDAEPKLRITYRCLVLYNLFFPLFQWVARVGSVLSLFFSVAFIILFLCSYTRRNCGVC